MYGYDYYNYGYAAEAAGESIAAGIMIFVIYLLVYGIIFAFSLANYVIRALAYMRIAKKRGISKSWLAWIPIAENYIVGEVASSYDKEKGIERKWGQILLLTFVIGYGIFYIGYFIFIVAAMLVAATAGVIAEEMLALVIIGFVILFIFLFLAMLGVITWSILRQICNFKNYEGMVPQKAVKYTVLSILVPLAGPILLLKCSKLIPDVNAPVEEVPVEETPVIEE